MQCLDPALSNSKLRIEVQTLGFFLQLYISCVCFKNTDFYLFDQREGEITGPFLSSLLQMELHPGLLPGRQGWDTQWGPEPALQYVTPTPRWQLYPTVPHSSLRHLLFLTSFPGHLVRVNLRAAPLNLIKKSCVNKYFFFCGKGFKAIKGEKVGQQVRLNSHLARGLADHQ